jgi:phospholipase C
VIVSPLIPKNLIEHRRLEHASIPATLIDLFKLPELQHSRTQSVSGIKHLAHLQTPRTDTPLTLHSVEVAAKPKPAFFDVVAREPNAPLSKDPDGSLADLIRWVVAQHLQVAPNQRKAILARARQLQTHADALAYMKEVHGLVRAERVKAGIVRAKRVKAGLAHD